MPDTTGMTEVFRDTHARYGYTVFFDEDTGIYHWECEGRTGTAPTYKECVIEALDPVYQRIIGARYGQWLSNSCGLFDDAMQEARIRVLKAIPENGKANASYIITAALWGASAVMQSSTFRHESGVGNAWSTTMFEYDTSLEAPALVPENLTTHASDGESTVENSEIIMSLPADLRVLALELLSGYTVTDLYEKHGMKAKRMLKKMRDILRPEFYPETNAA